MTERPSSPLDNAILNNTATIEQLMNKQSQMEQMMSQMFAVVSKLQQPVERQKDTKMPDVKEFGGEESSDYNQFEILLEAFFRNQPNRFTQDSSKIDYVGSRLKGKALDWYTNFYLGEKKKSSGALFSYDLFWEKFAKQFKPKYGSMVAEHQIYQLKQGNANIKDYIQDFEKVLALTTNVAAVHGVFLRSVSEKTLKEILEASRVLPNLLVDYEFLKDWLLQGFAHQEILALSGQVSVPAFLPPSPAVLDHVTPMDLSRVEQKQKAKWKFMNPEEYKTFKTICAANHLCFKCREFKGHTDDCTENTRSSIYLSVINEGEIKVKVELPLFNNHSILALVDTGAQGHALISSKVIASLDIKCKSIDQIALRAFDGSILDVISQTTLPLKCLINDHMYEISFLIASNLKEDAILGIEWLRQNSVVIDCVDGTLHKKLQNGKCLKIRVVEMSDPSDISLLPSFLQEFDDVFDLQKAAKLPDYDPSTAMPITLIEGKTVPQSFPYKLSAQEESALKLEIDQGLASGKIVCSDAFGSSPVLFVKKDNGRKLRMCVDYRKVNELTVSTQAILPNIQDVLASLGTQTHLKPLYSKIDLKGAFNLLRLSEGSEDLSTFVTKYGKYKYRVIPFGLKNAPGHFQNVMNKLLANVIGQGVYVYIDDILIYEREQTKHRCLLNQVLSLLRKAGLIANLSKCQFMVDRCEFLGFELGPDGIKMLKSKVDAIDSFPAPKSLKQLQSFLGICNFYRTFLPCYAELCKPLLQLLKKNSSFQWSKDCSAAFTKIKDMFKSDCFLKLPDRSEPFFLYCDASNFAVGAALHQHSAEGKLQPVAFFSRKLTDAERNYTIFDKELLAIKEPLSHWRHLLINTATPIVIYSDHDNLTYFKSPQKLNQRQARWQQFLADYNFQIQHLPGALNQVADALSRRKDYSDASPHIATLLPSSLFVSAIENEPSREDVPLSSAEESAVANPSVTSNSVWPIFMYNFLLTKQIPDSLPSRFKKRIQKEKHMFYVNTGQLFRKIRFNGQDVAVPYLQSTDRMDIMRQTHETLGHLGVRATFPSLLVRFWWPGVRTDYESFCKACPKCQLNNSSTRPITHPMHPLPDPGAPFHTWHLDFIQDLPVTARGNSQILIAVDRSTRYTVACPLSNRETGSTLGFLHQLCTRFGVPHRIITDRAGYFMHEFAEYCRSQGIQLDHTSSYHPQTNSLVERTNGILEGILRKECDGMWTKWDLFLDSAILKLNSRHHSTTGFSPFYLAHGISPRLPLHDNPPRLFNFRDPEDKLLYTTRELEKLGQARASALFRSNDQARRMALTYDKNHKTMGQRFVPGQFVKRLRKRLPNQIIPKLSTRWEGPFIIESAGPHDSYILKKPNGELEQHPVNANHLAPYISSQDLAQVMVAPSVPLPGLVLQKRRLLRLGFICVLSFSRKGIGEEYAVRS